MVMKAFSIAILACLTLTVPGSVFQAQAQYTTIGEPTKRAAPALPYGVEDVLKLSLAGISETVILRFIEVSGIVYQLEVEHLIYLRDQGVSDAVINAMLAQRTKVAETQPPATSQASTSAVASPPPKSTHSECPVNCSHCGGQMYTRAKESKPSSSLHIIPYTSAVWPSSLYRNFYRGWGPYRTYRGWGPYSYYTSRYVPACGWYPYTCGHWHGCRPWL